jgi:hypothetical protein
VVRVSDDELRDAMRLMWYGLKLAVEPACAAATAALVGALYSQGMHGTHDPYAWFEVAWWCGSHGPRASMTIDRAAARGGAGQARGGHCVRRQYRH